MSGQDGPEAGSDAFEVREPEDAGHQSLQLPLSRWDDEGGARRCGPQEGMSHHIAPSDIPELTNTQLVQVRVRVIALENLVTALLS